MAIREIDLSDQGNRSSRYGAQVKWWVFHTEEGSSNFSPGNAQRLHDWMRRNEVSYHYVSDAGTVIAAVDTDYSSWSVLDANPRCINWCFAGSKASYTRADWLRRSDELDYAARVIVQDAAKYDPLTPTVLGKDYRAIGRGVAGVIDHSGITYGLGMGSHTDCGAAFPFDYVQDAVSKLLAPSRPAAPPVNQIDLEAARASSWIGARVTAGENSTPDKVGRWAQFERGYIYWSPGTGAHAVPLTVFETWASLGFEAGELGYPIADHTVLPVDGLEKVGDVQAFERGVIYRRYGEPGYWVHGAIGERWKRDGFENSKWGWPVSDEKAIEGGRVQEFEHGYITWSPDGTLGLQPSDGPDYLVTPVQL